VCIPENDRRRLALSLITDEGDLISALVDNAHGLGLVGPQDLPWIVDQYAVSLPGRRPALARLFNEVYRVTDPDHVNVVLELPDDHPLTADIVGDWRSPVQLDSERARRLRAEWELKQPPEELAVDDAEVEQSITSQVEAALDGDPAGFCQATQLVRIPPGKRHCEGESQPDLTAHLSLNPPAEF
jgi:hypothetical protein